MEAFHVRNSKVMCTWGSSSQYFETCFSGEKTKSSSGTKHMFNRQCSTDSLALFRVRLKACFRVWGVGLFFSE